MNHGTFRPLEAARAIRSLLQNPEATEEAFTIVRVIDNGGIDRLHARWTASPDGRRLLRERPSLLDLLENGDGLRAMPEGSLGHAYLAFSEREGISPGGLVEASENEERALLDDERRYIADRMRESHDLWHVVTGCRTDLAGELSVLAFTTAQIGALGIGVLTLAGYAYSFTLPGEVGKRGRRLARESFLRGRRAEWLPVADWEGLFPLPIEEARAKLGITSVISYVPLYKNDLAAAA